MNKKSKGIVAAACLSFVFLAFLAMWNYVPNTDKAFGVDNFYTGTYGESVDPKAVYDAAFYNILAGEKSCRTEMEKSENVFTVGSFTWIKESKMGEKKKDFENIVVSGCTDLSEIMPYKKDGQNIVAPAQLTFINSNCLQYDKDKISIVAYIGNDYVIEFDDVKTWWCHIGKADPKHHTEVIGVGGKYAKCSQGYIIGQAKTSTIVRLYKIDDNGKRQPHSFYKLFVKGK